MYRWFIHDPIRFRRSIRWTIEHGHANNFENDYSSVAYWYQTEPHRPFPSLPARPAPRRGVARVAECCRSPVWSRPRTCSERAGRGRRRYSIVRPGAPYSKGAVAVFFDRKPTGWIRFTLPVKKAGRWRVAGHFARASDMGRYQLLVEAGRSGRRSTSSTTRKAGAPRTWCRQGRWSSESLDLDQGECELKFQCVGKGDRSSGCYLAVDGFTLRPVPPREHSVGDRGRRLGARLGVAAP